MTRSADSDLTTDKREAESRQLEMELWQSLAQYMSTEVPYTIKRLLPADLKVSTGLNIKARPCDSTLRISELICRLFGGWISWFTISIGSQPFRRWLCLCALHEKGRNLYYGEYSLRMVSLVVINWYSAGIQLEMTYGNEYLKYKIKNLSQCKWNRVEHSNSWYDCDQRMEMSELWWLLLHQRHPTITT